MRQIRNCWGKTMSWFRAVEAVDTAERRRQERQQEAEEYHLVKMSKNAPDHNPGLPSWRSKVASLVLAIARITLAR
jgi:hypothetical protein